MSTMPLMSPETRIFLTGVGIAGAFALAGLCWLLGRCVCGWFSAALDSAAEDVR